MKTKSLSTNARIKALNAVLDNKNHQTIVKRAIQANPGDTSAALETLSHKLPKSALQKVALAQSLAEWSGDNVPVVKALTKQQDVTSLRDVALRYDADALVGLIDEKSMPKTATVATPEEKKKNFSAALHNKLFAAETSAVLQRMVEVEEVPIADAGVKPGVVTFLKNQPDFNIRPVQF